VNNNIKEFRIAKKECKPMNANVHKINENEFLLEGTKGVNTGKSSLKSILLIALFVTVFTMVPFVLFQVFGKGIIDFVNTGGGGFELTINIKTIAGTAAGAMMIFVLLNSSILGLAFGTIIAEKFIHKRSIQRMFSLGKFNFKALYFGLIAWAILIAFSSFVDVFVFHENYVFNWDINKWLIFLPVVLLLTPLQCISEEIFFRTYLMRSIYTKTQKTIFVILIMTIIFALVHLPNIALMSGGNLVSYSVSFVAYLTISYLLTYLTYVSQGLELSIGIHIANNIMYFIVINSLESYTGFVPSVFDVKSTNIYWGCISLILSSLILIAVYSKLKNQLE
jgi:membrane protease YdiL (CAAX protease family)